MEMDMDEDSCSMNMLFTWSYKNTCVVFRWWHIRSFAGLVGSFIMIALLAYLYEYLKYQLYNFQCIQENQPLVAVSSSARRRIKIYEGLGYALQVGFSFMLMLVFMTYNGWLMLAVVVGAFFGHYSWNLPPSAITDHSTLACH